jgi:hypothetical protein
VYDDGGSKAISSSVQGSWDSGAQTSANDENHPTMSVQVTATTSSGFSITQTTPVTWTQDPNK